MYSKNLQNRESIAFAPSGIAEPSLWVKSVSPEELALFFPRISQPVPPLSLTVTEERRDAAAPVRTSLGIRALEYV